MVTIFVKTMVASLVKQRIHNNGCFTSLNELTRMAILIVESNNHLKTIHFLYLCKTIPIKYTLGPLENTHSHNNNKNNTTNKNNNNNNNQ
jgi:hypothetical protein